MAPGVHPLFCEHVGHGAASQLALGSSATPADMSALQSMKEVQQVFTFRKTRQQCFVNLLTLANSR